MKLCSVIIIIKHVLAGANGKYNPVPDKISPVDFIQSVWRIPLYSQHGHRRSSEIAVYLYTIHYQRSPARHSRIAFGFLLSSAIAELA